MEQLHPIISHRIPLHILKQGIFQKMEGWNNSYVSIEGKNIQQINIFGTIIAKDQNTSGKVRAMTIDDSTEQISVRIFDEKQHVLWENASVGQMIRIVGSVREYMGEIYLVPKIMKHIQNPTWFSLQQSWWGKPQTKKVETQNAEKVTDFLQKDPMSVIEIIRTMDKGNGVAQEEILSHVKEENPKKIIESLVRQGEIFEVRPGFYKTLY